MPSIVPLVSCIDPRAGRKATHLSKLAAIGLRVPDGFVVIGALPGALPADIDAAHAALGGPVAVRSSAQDEDGENASFAGQYDTFLNIDGASAVRAAIDRCLVSARSARADAPWYLVRAAERRACTHRGAPSHGLLIARVWRADASRRRTIVAGSCAGNRSIDRDNRDKPG